MDLIRRGVPDARCVAILPAAWNPPTRAHLALAEAALGFADEVLLALPRVFPHKEFEHASFDLRLEWLRRIAADRPGLGVAVTEGGLFLEMARALRAADPDVERIYIVCGRDAAARFLAWPYGRGPGAIDQLREFSLLVAPRDEPFATPDLLRDSIHELDLNAEVRSISSTEIRRRIAQGEPWTHWVPEEVIPEAGRIYQP
jgi:nicotinic acid mononucleotide adenylyltransferase